MAGVTVTRDFLKVSTVELMNRALGFCNVLLALMGITMIVTGAWLMYEPAGWVTAGLAVLVIEHRVDIYLTSLKGGGGG